VKVPPRWRSPVVLHATRVAAVATVIIGALYICVVAGFDAVDRHRLVAQIDTRLESGLVSAAQYTLPARSTGEDVGGHDLDDPPVFLWRVDSSGRPRALTPGAPALAASAWRPAGGSVDAQLGIESFRLRSQRIDGRWFVAGQSLAVANHVDSDVIALEVVAGPALLLAVFLGTLLIGIKAAMPVEQARRRQLEFTADASHELRTPLSVIEAEVSLALTGTREVGDYRDTLGRVSREAARLRDIVEDLLWLSRFDSQPPPPGDEPVDVGAIATACADRFDAVASRRGIALSIHHRVESQPWVNAPPEWIDRLTAVLVDNACRYAGDNGMVQITVTAQGNRVGLAVEDDGPGIAPEARARLFDRFHRATDQGNGAGLGLAIGDAVVRATGGEWRVGESPLGGALMEVRWHRSPGARDLAGPGEADGQELPNDWHRTDHPVVGSGRTDGTT
jgi:signal transduction histidine kinase